MSGAPGRVRAIGGNTLREIVRERVLYNLVFFLLLMSLCTLLARDLSIRQHGKMIMDFGLAAIQGVGTLIAVFLGSALLGRELERRSVYVLLAKPLSRTELLLGKFAGLGVALLINVAAMTVLLYLALWITSSELKPELLMAVGALFLGMLLASALALAFSSVTGPTLATVSTFALVIAGHYTDIVRNMGEMTKLPAWLVRTLYLALPNFLTFDLKDRVVHGDPVSFGDLGLIAAYGAAYVTVLLGLAATAFRRREL